MGKGDKKTRRGKIVMGSFGVSRKKAKSKFTSVPVSKEVVKEEKKVVVQTIEKPLLEAEATEKPKKDVSKKVKEPTPETEKKASKKTSKKDEEGPEEGK